MMKRRQVLGYDIAALCFNGPAETLNLTEHTQPALLVSSIAALRALDPRRLHRRQSQGIVWVSTRRSWQRGD